MKLNIALLMTASLLIAGAMNLGAGEVKNTSSKTPGGERIQRLETTVDCSLEKAWELFATNEGMRSWIAPVLEVDVRNGGRWEYSYDKTKKIGDPGNIVSEFLCVVPMEMHVSRVLEVPDNFPFDRERTLQIRAVLQFEAVGADRAKLKLTATGYGEGPEWDRIYNFFLWGNRVRFEELHKRIENGPVDWDAEDDKENTFK